MRTATPAALLVLVLSACGGDGDTAANGGTTLLEAEATEFAFTPDAWFGSEGDSFSIQFTNAGSIAHNWALLSQPVETEAEITEDAVLIRLEADAGQTVAADIPIDLEPGTYQVVCDIAGHFNAGMEGELQVSG